MNQKDAPAAADKAITKGEYLKMFLGYMEKGLDKFQPVDRNTLFWTLTSIGASTGLYDVDSVIRIIENWRTDRFYTSDEIKSLINLLVAHIETVTISAPALYESTVH